ncbi:hypothetical protein ACFQU0_11525 [Hydrogenophaga defluvii]|uniref:Uncharacterized protein n=2 Tax=Hydrogenophaga defluvii TaxID=249410 RepID=A0ABW2SBZ2_9BURK
MKQFNRWQRIAVLASLSWFGLCTYYLWQDFPTQGSIDVRLSANQAEEFEGARRELDDAKRQCEIQSGGNVGQDILAGCSKQAVEKYRAQRDLIREHYSSLSEQDSQELPKRQLLVLLHLLAIGVVVPMAVYSAIAWVARAPKG